MTKQIVKLKVTEGSVVPKGANQRAHIRLFKMDGKQQPKASLWKRMAQSFKAQKEGKAKMDKVELQKKMEERKSRIQKIRDKFASLRKNRTNAKPIAKPMHKIDPRESIAQRLNKIRMDRNNSEVISLKKQLQEEKSIRLHKEYLAKVEQINVAGKTTKDELATVLEKCYQKDEKLGKQVEEIITATSKAWNEAASQLTKVLGSDNEATASSEHQQLVALAKGIQKEQPKMTEAQAYVEAMKRNPSLANKVA